MQSVNVLPTFVSQEPDLKDKSTLSPSGDSPADSEFSRLVDRHVSDERKASHNKSEQNNAESKVARSGDTVAKSGNNTESESSRQENDSTKEANTESATKNSKASKESAVEKEGIAKQENKALKEGVTKADDATVKDFSGNAEDETLTESEQFISLLYNSDQTLNAKTQSKQGPDSSQQVSSTTNDNAEIIEETHDELSDKNKTSSASAEHKLKSFSKEELLARASLKANAQSNGQDNALTAQANNQVNKGELLAAQSTQNTVKSSSITSDQLMKAQLANSDLKHNKISELAAGVSQANKGNVKEQGLSTEVEKIVDELSDLAKVKASVTKDADLVQSKNETKSEVKNQLMTDEIKNGVGNVADEPLDETSKNGITAAASELLTSESKQGNVVNAVGEQTVKNTMGKNSVDKLMSAGNTPISSATDNTSKEQPLDNQVNKSANQTASQIQAAQALQQSLAQQKASGSEEQLIDDAAEEYLDSTGLTEDSKINPGAKPINKVMDALTMRTSSELQAQSIQSTQSQQSNDAYMEFQSSEALNHAFASDTVQIQKNNVLLQQETISIFRKDFTDAVKDKVMVMINQKLQQFDITLDPPEFGNMHVRVNLQGEQASVNFVVQNQQAKDALEQNMGKLRDMLAEQGVDVGGANVEQQNQQQDGEDNNLAQQGDQNATLSKNDEEDLGVEHILSTNLFDSPAAGVDYYA